MPNAKTLILLVSLSATLLPAAAEVAAEPDETAAAAPAPVLERLGESDPGPDQSGKVLTLAELMRKVFLAYGGRERLLQFNESYVMHGSQTRPAAEGGEVRSAFRQMRKGGKLRIDLLPSVDTGGDGATAVTTAYDGRSAWKAVGSRVSDLSAEEACLLADEPLRHPSVLARFGEPGYEFGLLGRTTYNHMPVYSLEVKAGSATATTFYIGERNYLVMGLSYPSPAAGRAEPLQITEDFSEYRPAGGTMVPFRQAQYVDGKPAAHLTLESIAFDRPIEESQFVKPGEVAAPRLTQPVTVAAEYSHSEIVVKVRVNNGDELDFLVDTGASDTIVDRRTAAEHYLDKQADLSIAAASGAVTTQTSVIRKLEVGAVVLNDVPALVLDLTPQSRQLGRRIAGIIGANVLGAFVVAIDYAAPAVIFRDPASYNPPQGATIVPFTRRQAPLVRALLNGKDEQVFLIDTGAAFNHLPAQAARRYTQGQPQHFTEGTGLDGRPVKLGTVVVDSVQLGAEKVSKVAFTYPAGDEAPRARGGFFQTADLGILGNPFWQNFLVTLDYKFQRLILQENVALRRAQEIKQLLSSADAKLVIHRDYRAADALYQKALAASRAGGDGRNEALVLGRLGNLQRMMARDLKRPEQSRVSYDYFVKAQALARKAGDREVEGRVLADWSLLYSDNGQESEARSTLESALMLAPQDPQVNVNYAVHLYRARRFEEMQKYVAKALFLDPANWQALWYQVKLAEMAFDVPRQAAALKEILRFYPWSKLAREKLSALAPAARP